MGPSTRPGERELIGAVLRKDRKASAEFVELHAGAVYSYVRHRLLPRTDLVDDLVQDVFLAAWESLAGFRGEAPVRAWLIGIARHRVEDYYRARLQEGAAQDEDTASLPDPAAGLQLDDALDREKLSQKTEEILAGLPEAYSVALLWRYWEKRSAREMAQFTGRSEKAIERTLARARALFKERWNGNRSGTG